MTDPHPPKAYPLDAFAHIPEAPDDGSPRPARPDLDAPVVADDGFRVHVTFTAAIPERFPGHDDGQRTAQLRRAIDSAIDQYLLGSGDLEAATITLGEDTISDQAFSDREPTDIRGQQWVRVEGPHTREALRAEEREREVARLRQAQSEPSPLPYPTQSEAAAGRPDAVTAAEVHAAPLLDPNGMTAASGAEMLSRIHDEQGQADRDAVLRALADSPLLFNLLPAGRDELADDIMAALGEGD